MAKGLSMVVTALAGATVLSGVSRVVREWSLGSRPNLAMLRSAEAWMPRDDVGPLLGAEQVRVAGLEPQVVGDGTWWRIGVELTTSPFSASKTGNRPVSVASRATLIVSAGELPQPSGQGTRMCR